MCFSVGISATSIGRSGVINHHRPHSAYARSSCCRNGKGIGTGRADTDGAESRNLFRCSKGTIVIIVYPYRNIFICTTVSCGYGTIICLARV
ncbi:hypothetical protein D3C72_747050 [compost metagenome]